MISEIILNNKKEIKIFICKKIPNQKRNFSEENQISWIFFNSWETKESLFGKIELRIAMIFYLL